ncbi:hypothetical protein EXS73_01345 [Candidatus Pacearchaeota archaeon]|nr:hypothetical protein [Candidatus Pacearchaeota archaeon]
MGEVKVTSESLRAAEISLQLDMYDDIFSDFDPRPFSQRALSDDFLLEARRASRDKPNGAFEIRFMMPKEDRNPAEEQLIKRRLKDHFHKHYVETVGKTTAVTRKGYTLIILGIFVALGGGYIALYEHSFFAKVAIIVLEPASWFCIWSGFDHLVFNGKEYEEDLVFYEKMRNADILFEGY